MDPDFWFYLRMFNITAAVLAVLLLGIRHIRKDWRFIPPYKRASALSNEAYGVCYVIATVIAETQGVEAGVYTGVMSIPIFWHLFAGLLDDPDKDAKQKR